LKSGLARAGEAAYLQHMAKMPKRPRDPNQLAKTIVEIATGERNDSVPAESPMSELGRSGGLKGGKARAATMSPERRREVAAAAAKARWAKRDI
jgi:hypothetical protein